MIKGSVHAYCVAEKNIVSYEGNTRIWHLRFVLIDCWPSHDSVTKTFVTHMPPIIHWHAPKSPGPFRGPFTAVLGA